MRKITAILLSLIMICSLTACNSQTNKEENSTTNEQTEAPIQDTTEKPEETTETDTEPEDDSPAFDTSWASNDFEKLIPQPPFEGWTGSADSDGVYKMVTSEANADEKLNADGTFAYYDTWTGYIRTLSDYGFTVDGNVYKATATDSNGNTIELMCGDGHAWITITIK